MRRLVSRFGHHRINFDSAMLPSIIVTATVADVATNLAIDLINFFIFELHEWFD
jgi:hypothetical protein